MNSLRVFSPSNGVVVYTFARCNRNSFFLIPAVFVGKYGLPVVSLLCESSMLPILRLLLASAVVMVGIVLGQR